MAIKIKRAYEPPEPSDGTRVLVDRLWPRGMTKERAHIDEWMKEIAPSDELRIWFGHDPGKWTGFQKRYRKELHHSEQEKCIKKLRALAEKGTVTLVYGASDEDHNNAQVIRGVLDKS